MNQILSLLVLIVLLMSCTQNQRARNWGGEEKIELEKGRRVVNISWHDDDIWILTEEMDSSKTPRTLEFIEKSSFMLDGKVIIVESK